MIRVGLIVDVKNAITTDDWTSLFIFYCSQIKMPRQPRSGRICSKCNSILDCDGRAGQYDAFYCTHCDEEVLVRPGSGEKSSPINEKKKKKEKDPNAPKRNKSAFLFFKTKVYPTVKAKHPGATMGEMSKIISHYWKKLTPEKREKYQVMALEDKARYEKEKKAYEGKSPKKSEVEDDLEDAQADSAEDDLGSDAEAEEERFSS
jgi:hypothetical protein